MSTGGTLTSVFHPLQTYLAEAGKIEPYDIEEMRQRLETKFKILHEQWEKEQLEAGWIEAPG